MKIRDFISIVESNLLNEAAGTHGFYHPATDTEIEADGGHAVEHADYVIENPARFGLTDEEVQNVVKAQRDAHDVHASDRMQLMTRVLNLMFTKGWVRVNYFRGGWSFHAIDLETATAALKSYASENWIDEAILEWGPDAAHPERSHSLYPREEVQRYLKTRKLIKP